MAGSYEVTIIDGQHKVLFHGLEGHPKEGNIGRITLLAMHYTPAALEATIVKLCTPIDPQPAKTNMPAWPFVVLAALVTAAFLFVEVPQVRRFFLPVVDTHFAP